MNISQWPVGRIMQLPDCVFGRRWPIIFTLHGIETAVTYHISELALPDVCVLWELYSFISPLGSAVTPPLGLTSIMLGDQLPTTDAEMALMEPLLPGADEMFADMRVIRGQLHLDRLRNPISAQGRRVVVRFQVGSIVPTILVVGLVFSSMPKEVPDWLISAQGKSQL